MIERQGELLQLTIPADEGGELLAQSQCGASEAGERVGLSSCSIGREGRDDKASLEERAGRRALDHGPGLRARHKVPTLHARLAFGVSVRPPPAPSSSEHG